MVDADGPQKTERQAWMATLARATSAEVDAIVELGGGLPAHTVLKPAQTGTIMVEGRAGGTGRRFNVGEATMTRCVVRLDDGGQMGFAYALGTDRRKAHRSAVIDAMLQRPEAQGSALKAEIEALAARQRGAKELASRKAARTKVDFFTMVRGHN